LLVTTFAGNNDSRLAALTVGPPYTDGGCYRAAIYAYDNTSVFSVRLWAYMASYGEYINAFRTNGRPILLYSA